MSVGHQNKKAVEKSVLNYFNSQSIWQSCRRSQIPDEPCMTGVRCSRNHPPRIDENNRNCSENSARPDSTKISHLLLTTPPRRAEPPSECATTKQAIRSAGSVRPSGLRPRFLSPQLPQKRKQIRKIVTPFCKGPLFEKPQSAYLADRLSITASSANSDALNAA